MDITTYSHMRKNLKAVMDKVCADRAAITVTRKNGEDVVVMSREDYNALQETLYLTQNPANAERLRSAIASDQTGIEFDSPKAFDDAFNL